jgi:hypothetical protein
VRWRRKLIVGSGVVVSIGPGSTYTTLGHKFLKLFADHPDRIQVPKRLKGAPDFNHLGIRVEPQVLEPELTGEPVEPASAPAYKGVQVVDRVLTDIKMGVVRILRYVRCHFTSNNFLF